MEDNTYTAEPNSLAITWSYVLDAPREKVFKAYTDPELIPKWWAPGDGSLRVDKMDVKNGGEWRFVDSDGTQEFSFRGVYHSVAPNEQIVGTWQFEGFPSVAFETVTFEDAPGGKTKITDQMVFQSIKDRQGLLDTGMDAESTADMGRRLAKLL